MYIWIMVAFGLLVGLAEIWTKNRKNLELEKQEGKGFNSKKTGIIIGITLILVMILVIFATNNLGTANIFSGNKKYEEIAQDYIDSALSEYSSSRTLVDTSSYTYDEEVRVTLKYRITDGPNVSYTTYTVVVDKDTKEVIGINQNSY